MPAITLPQLYWGPTLEHRFDCAWPLEAPLAYPVPRAGSAVVQASDAAAEDGWYVGTDYQLEADVRYVPPASGVAPLAGGSTPPNGMDALLGWARQRGKVRLVPDRTALANAVDGYLVDPWNGPPAQEALDGTLRYHLRLRTTARSYAEALRGLLFEYLPGMSLTDPRVFTATRAQAAYYFDATGAVVQAAANVLRDRHYPFGLGSAVRTALLEPASTNSCLQSQTFNDAGWTKTNTTVSADATAAPDGTTTADKLVENTDTALVHRIDRAVTITSLEFLAVSCYVKAAGRTRLRVGASDGTLAAKFFADANLTAGTVAGLVNGGASITGVRLTPLVNGWWWIGAWGVLPAGTTARLDILLEDGTGAATYNGDGTSGVYLWGAQLERWGTAAGAVSPPTSYMPTVGSTASRALDLVTVPWPYTAVPLWCYTKVVDLGGSVRGVAAGSGQLVALTTAAASDPQWLAHLHRSDGKPGTSWISDAGALSGGFHNRNTVAGAGSAPAPYDTVETFSRVGGDGAANFAMRVNAGAVAVSSQVGPTVTVPFVTINTPTLLKLGSGGCLDGVLVIKVGTDPTVTTLDAAAAV